MAHASAAASELPEVVAGRYRVERLLGKGGLGCVYEVHDAVSGKRLALKRLSSEGSAASAALFEREYHALAGLRHPNIVEVYEYGRDEGLAFYTMELIEGSDLGFAPPMPWREACRCLRDAASIVAVLHARRIVHRDLSPRNLLRTPTGRLKLIDFGALTPFGPSKQLVGTPPFVAPEAGRLESLDQRTDLFALGAIAYWLMTGVHAFPARSLADLPRHWEREPAPPSQLLRLIRSADLEPIPAELDALVASLLRIDPAQRPSSTAELIDRLHTIAALEPESDDLTVQGYLNSKAFVGRARERDRALLLLDEANAGGVRTLLVEGDPGVGRTRFLQELVVLARLRGALPLVADPSEARRPFGIASTLLVTLLRALPELAVRVAQEHASVLGYLSKDVGAALKLSARPSISHASAETRVRILSALREVLLTVSRSQLLAIVVDDLQEVDEESQALLTSLYYAGGEHRLWIVAALGRAHKRDASAAMANLRANASRLPLGPLKLDETLEVLRSVFGQAPYLERLAERLYRASGGNPAFCLELAQHLIQTGVARYQDGAWSLPVELSLDHLPKSRQAAYVARLDRLSADARALARSLSVPHSTAFTEAQCLAVSDLSEARVRALLTELEQEEVLRRLVDGHRFAHDSVQAALHQELPEAERERAHRRLGAQIAALPERDVLDELRACVHFLRGGDVKRAFAAQLVVIGSFSKGDVSFMSRAAPLLEEVYTLHRARGHDDYAVVGVLGLLGIAGFHADRSYARKYGELAISTLEGVLKLPLARRLSRFVGPKQGLMLALAAARVALQRRQDRAPDVDHVVRLLLGTASSLVGTATCCVDPAGVARYAEVIAPFRVLGEDHAATIMYQAACSSLPHLRDQPALAVELLHSLIARLESPRKIYGLPDGVKANYLWGALSLLGVIQSWRDGPECLQTAERLEQCSPMYAMNADYLRYSYYAGQGDLARATHYRKRMEVHAVELGSAWQAETWAPADAVKVALRTQDASVLKREIQELQRLSLELPWLARFERVARGTYLVLRHKYAEAIPLLDTGDAPRSFGGWSRNQGVLAHAYNQLGDHTRAKDICTHALSFRQAEDLSYVSVGLNVQIELAMAEAGLGNLALAARQLDALLVHNAPDESAITLGALHHARARVALLERDFPAAREHLRELSFRYRSTGVATLIEVVEVFKRELARAQPAHEWEGERESDPESEDPTLRMQRALLGVERLRGEPGNDVLSLRASKSLQLALEVSGAEAGLIVLASGEGGAVAQFGIGTSRGELVMWAEQSMLDAGVDEQTALTEEIRSEIESNYKVVGPIRYCVIPLWARVGREDRVVAALVLGFQDRVPRIPEPAVVHGIAMHLIGS